MNLQQQLYEEIEALPLDAQETILKMVHFLKTEILTPMKSKPRKMPKLPLQTLICWPLIPASLILPLSMIIISMDRARNEICDSGDSQLSFSYSVEGYSAEVDRFHPFIRNN